ncbi:MAG: phosphate/phosphite/phosphonate ABC transporter substrate-binding protein [Gemmataceae bacterium]|nr:phosphate/phosphite/phosphonate ABC transporter substrate-binding protein [Gemmataceae bacterium]
MRRFFLACLICFTHVLSVCAVEPTKDSIAIGIPRSIFRDIPPALLSFANQPFLDLMKAQTGYKGSVKNDPEAMTLAKELAEGKLDLVVFLGHEFAWAKEKYPDLTPLVVATPRPKELRAYVLVRQDSKITQFPELKGQKIALPKTSRDLAKLYFEKKLAENDISTASFGEIVKADTVENALHMVVDGEADATFVDHASWNYYQKLHPGRSSSLKELSKSDPFPPTVIAYKKGSLDEATLKKLRDGLLTSHENKKGQILMQTIKLEKFDPVPEKYTDMIKECLKQYPTPK